MDGTGPMFLFVVCDKKKVVIRREALPFGRHQHCGNIRVGAAVVEDAGDVP